MFVDDSLCEGCAFELSPNAFNFFLLKHGIILGHQAKFGDFLN